ncbi:MAG: class I SAM-dependent methyltransferase [Candidatus Andersenbacteria bacterium]
MKYITRDKSIITGEKNLEPLYTFKNFPVFFGCVDTDAKDDVRADMSWAICPESGVIQLDKLIPLEILYQSQHVDGTGPTWKQYYQDFAKYIELQNPLNVLEIGGGQGELADIFIEHTKDTTWAIVEPNPLHEGSDRIKIVKGFFDKDFSYDGKIDTITFSQLMEHVYDPQEFIKSIADRLEVGQKLVFAYPNLKKWLEEKYTNALNFEHTMFLTDYFIDYILNLYGFSIVDKTFYKTHSVFYTAEKTGIAKPAKFENKYTEYKKIFLDFISYHNDLIADLNTKMSDFDGEVYLFGAHIFSQYLLEFGLDTSKIVALLDNSNLKEGKRLYGSNLVVQNPAVLAGKGRVGVILKVGIYRDEILKQIQEINPNVVVLE